MHIVSAETIIPNALAAGTKLFEKHCREIAQHLNRTNSLHDNHHFVATIMRR